MIDSNRPIDNVIVRMYRAGTGDFFILKFMQGETVSFKLMIDCGCIQGSKEIFAPMIDDLKNIVGKEIDLLVVTHEHADHINGFKIASAQLSQITFHKVWFAWTEDRDDDVANDYRKRNARMKTALAIASAKLTSLQAKKYFEERYEQELFGIDLLASQNHFINALSQLDVLNVGTDSTNLAVPTMEDMLRSWNIITDNTEVEYLSPGELRQKIPGLPGINIFVLGPPKDLSYLNIEEKKGENYQKREKRSTLELSIVNALVTSSGAGHDTGAFDTSYILTNQEDPVKIRYTDEPWRNIDHDWLLGAGTLALKLQRCINNTSLVLAFQFHDSEKVMLFPGDAEFGSWQSWHDQLKWEVDYNGNLKKVNAEYLLNHTIFYKVSHHLSQNGTPTIKGLDMMTQPQLAAMATLDLEKIMSGWLNTMPNDLLSAALINKTTGSLYFVGRASKIVDNIETARTTVSKANLNLNKAVNSKFDGKCYIEHVVRGS